MRHLEQAGVGSPDHHIDHRPGHHHAWAIGPAVGTVAVYDGWRIDTGTMLLPDIFFPSLILSVAFMSTRGPALRTALIAIALTAWPHASRATGLLAAQSRIDVPRLPIRQRRPE